ncbi:class IIb bacteriocin, lactobin A/cerein 7B family [Flagellimonas profundi]|uniref:Class IIb bacteriocin, lactobin A/cerein 7B family n=1 Tax=Flagellimonas profundi TaxID=2915620 RepID=A0ABS3FCL7_9FLAO|nr:class IIb bacteriocin, lactobin A/cerein 7B family [Allomuricauda profundi]MBO0340895.1 class IIb bacteriocin, lactobin A/cerein 7B family [Allomuricauda profundi]
MKNLENFGVLELDAQELNQIKGGVWPIIAAACGIAIAGMAAGYYAGKAYYYSTH